MRSASASTWRWRLLKPGDPRADVLAHRIVQGQVQPLRQVAQRGAGREENRRRCRAALRRS